ncbi:hypothetical protein [Roseicella aquatilis]|uniref:Lipoprotein n=1 Tax=Roseicella aquatilis TaxID=2527868 RepID=A0A4V2WJP5_9PROT|nr:hypothetical protein [Roseicella aquatilis]TCZ55384.1 hypothetical protein EXY23_21450 [Roseicella aquatilis]
MRRGPLLLLILLAACAARPPAPAMPAVESGELAERAAEIGGLVRAAQLCGFPLSQPSLERAARIEEAALELHRSRGGTTARNAFLHDVAPPRFEARQRGRDRAAWCMERQPAARQMDSFLNGPEGTALVQRAEAARSGMTR